MTVNPFDSERRQRKEDMLLLRSLGWTLAEISVHYGISRQRVNQIIGDSPRRSLAEKYWRLPALWHEGLTMKEIANALGITATTANELAVHIFGLSRIINPDLAKKGLRKCGRCHDIKLLADFANDSELPEGKAYVCSECNRVNARYQYQKRKGLNHDANKRTDSRD